MWSESKAALLADVYEPFAALVSNGFDSVYDAFVLRSKFEKHT